MSLPVSLFLEAMEVLPRRATVLPAISLVVLPDAAVGSMLIPALLDLAEQHVGGLEIIIVDDGSRGHLRNTLVELWRKNDRVTLLRFPRSGGIPAIGLNAALQCTTGRYVAYQTGRGCYRDDALVRIIDWADRSGTDVLTTEACWPPGSGTSEEFRLDNIIHRRCVLDRVGMADPHLLMRGCWDEDLRQRLTTELSTTGVPATFSQRFKPCNPEPPDPLVSQRRALFRATRLQPGRVETMDVLETSFLSDYQADQFADDLVAPYVASHWQVGQQLHSRAIPHMTPCRPVRVAIKGNISSPSINITFGNFAQVFPDLFSYRSVSAFGDDWPLSGDNARIAFREMDEIDTEVHEAFRSLGIPVLYAMDDDLVNIHEYPLYGKSFEQNQREHVIAHLRDADHVLTWSPACAEVVRPFNPSVSALRTNIPSGMLTKAPSPPAVDGRLIYTTLTNDLEHRAGTWESVMPQWADFFRRHRESVRLVLFGDKEREDQYYKRWFNGVDYELRASRPYAEYLKSSAESGFHVILTPMCDDITFVRSKCPVKLVEATAFGAILLVSDVNAYAVIEDGVHGLKVPDRPGAWTEALERSLALGKEGRAQIWQAARHFVKREFTTEAQFLALILSIETARLFAAARLSRRWDDRVMILLLESVMPKQAAIAHAWSRLLEQKNITTIVLPDGPLSVEDAARKLVSLHADHPIAVVHAPDLRSPWVAAARQVGLCCVATADLLDVTSSEAPPHQQPDMVMARSRTVAHQLREKGGADVMRLGTPLPNDVWTRELQTWSRRVDERFRIRVVCGSDSNLDRIKASLNDVPVSCKASRLLMEFSVGTDLDIGCSDILIVGGDGGEVIDAALRAMATGTLVVSDHSEDTQEILQDGVNGWVVGGSGNASLSQVLEQVRNLAPEQLTMVQQNARATAWARTADEVVLLTLLRGYRQALMKQPSGVPVQPFRCHSVDTFTSARHLLSEWTIDESRTAGWIDGARTPSRPDSSAWRDDDVLIVDGWAGDPDTGMQVQQVLFSLNGVVVGAVEVGRFRPDVAEVAHPNLIKSGWRARLLVGHLAPYASDLSDASLEAWAVDPDRAVLIQLKRHFAIHVPARRPVIALDRFAGRDVVTPPLHR